MKQNNFRTGSIQVMIVVGLTAHSVLPLEGRVVPCHVATELCEQQPPILSDDPAPKPRPQSLREIATIQSTAVMSSSALAASFRNF
jgi:hypothetical protein